MHIVMIGATGAVGNEVVRELVSSDRTGRLVLLGRRPLEGIDDPRVEQYVVDVLDAGSYAQHLAGARVAICTLGVGQPSKMGREEFTRIDRDAPLDFGRATREAGAEHFQLLSSVGVSSSSGSFYMRSKGELEDGLRALDFPRLSLFHPSMILTPTNRYDWKQGVMLAVWPWLHPVLNGPLRKFRGSPVEALGRAIARNVWVKASGTEVLEWDEISALAAGSIGT